MAASLQSLLLLSRGSAPFCCTCVSRSLSTHKDISHWIWDPLYSSVPHPNLITSARTLLPHEVTFLSAGTRTSTYDSGDTAYPTIATTEHWVISEQEAASMCASQIWSTPFSPQIQHSPSAGAMQGRGLSSYRPDWPTWSRLFLSEVRAWRTNHPSLSFRHFGPCEL